MQIDRLFTMTHNPVQFLKVFKVIKTQLPYKNEDGVSPVFYT
jgi:hypothetical protein